MKDEFRKPLGMTLTEPSVSIDEHPLTELDDWLVTQPTCPDGECAAPPAPRATRWPQISTPMNPHKEPRPTMGVAQIPILSLLFR